MNIRQGALGALAGLLVFAATTGVVLATDRPYTEGPVSVVTSVRTEPGMFQSYMKYLGTTYKQVMEEQKKAGIILDYAVYQTTPRTPHDPDVYLIVTYKNLAALDGLAERTDAIQEKLVGNQEQRDAAMVARGKMRTMLGSEQVRRLDLK